MARKNMNEGEHEGIDERLAEAQAEIESLQSTAADAEATAVTARQELTEARETISRLESALAEATSARDAAEGALSTARSEAGEVRSRLAEAAVKYREAMLAAAPEVPPELVPPAESLAEVDERFEAARRIAGQVQERLEEQRQSARVPVGSPPRRAPDLSSLSPSEKIRIGLRELSEREGRG